MMPFEDMTVSAPGCWDYYLKNLYGDYMQLPPEDKRETHSMDVWAE
jgi:lipopolysaccharide cholinephosphotransferase